MTEWLRNYRKEVKPPESGRATTGERSRQRRKPCVLRLRNRRLPQSATQLGKQFKDSADVELPELHRALADSKGGQKDWGPDGEAKVTMPMNPPAGPLRVEVHDAVVGGIRDRGSEAVGLLLIGGARLLLAVVVLLVLHLFGATFFGFNVLSIPGAGVSILAAVVSLLATHGRHLPSWGRSNEADDSDDGERGGGEN